MTAKFKEDALSIQIKYTKKWNLFQQICIKLVLEVLKIVAQQFF